MYKILIAACAAVLTVPAMADDHFELARALGYADSAMFDCQVLEQVLNDENRLAAMQRIADSGGYRAREAVLDAYMAAFREGQRAHVMAVDLGAMTPAELCDYAQEYVTEQLER